MTLDGERIEAAVATAVPPADKKYLLEILGSLSNKFTKPFLQRHISLIAYFVRKRRAEPSDGDFYTCLADLDASPSDLSGVGTWPEMSDARAAPFSALPPIQHTIIDNHMRQCRCLDERQRDPMKYVEVYCRSRCIPHATFTREFDTKYSWISQNLLRILGEELKTLGYQTTVSEMVGQNRLKSTGSVTILYKPKYCLNFITGTFHVYDNSEGAPQVDMFISKDAKEIIDAHRAMLKTFNTDTSNAVVEEPVPNGNTSSALPLSLNVPHSAVAGLNASQSHPWSETSSVRQRRNRTGGASNDFQDTLSLRSEPSYRDERLTDSPRKPSTDDGVKSKPPSSFNNVLSTKEEHSSVSTCLELKSGHISAEASENPSSPNPIAILCKFLLNFFLLLFIGTVLLDVLFYFASTNSAPKLPVGSGPIELYRILQTSFPKLKINLPMVLLESVAAASVFALWYGSEMNFLRKRGRGRKSETVGES